MTTKLNEDQFVPQAADCLVVIPCYNEERRLNSAEFISFISKQPKILLLFVNDGSTDRTIDLLYHLKATFPDQVDVLDKSKNGGKAEAVRDGLLMAINLERAPIIGFWDADLATPLEEILSLQAEFQNPQINMVFGARVRLLGRAIHRKILRHYLGRMFATCVSNVIRLPIYDTQCGAKLFRVTPEFHQLLTKPFLSRWIFDVEILARFIAGHKENPQVVASAIYEYPLKKWQDVAGSRLSGRDFMKAFWELLRIRRELWRE